MTSLGQDPAKTRLHGAKTRGRARQIRRGRGEDSRRCRAKDQETEKEEQRALFFDIGEGLLELGLVLCSLYFLARKVFFPVFGVLASLAGTILGVMGFML